MHAEVSLQASPFADDFVDVPALNAHVSDHLLDRVEAVQNVALAGEHVPSKAVVVLGPAGAGKTHLFARLRLLGGPRATFLLLRPYFGVSLTPRDVLASVIDQLCRPARAAKLSHLELIVAHWLVEPSERESAKGRSSFPSVAVEQVRSMTPAVRDAHVERATARVLEVLPELAPAARLISALLGVGALDRRAAWSELAWLSGREPRTSAEESSVAEALGETDVMHVLRLVSILAAPVAPLVLTFDQLENLASEGETRVLGYGNLLAELIDCVPSLTIVQLALTSEWLDFIEPRLSLPQKTRVAAETFLLEIPNRDERELLLRAWYERLAPKRNGRAMRFPRPLTKEQLEDLLSAPGMTPRLLLSALSRVLRGKPLEEVFPVSVVHSSETVPGEPLEERASPSALSTSSAREHLAQWVDEERTRIGIELDDKERSGSPIDVAELAEGLATALSFVPRLEVSTRSERERVFTSVKGPGHELVVAYLTSTHHASVAAMLARAADMARSTKVVIVREQRFELPLTWATVQERRAAFECMPNARWLWLSREDAVRCLMLARLLSAARAKRLRRPASSEPLSIDFVRAEVLTMLAPATWPCAASVERWISDVPKDALRSAAVQMEAPYPPLFVKKASEAADLGKMLRDWMMMGRSVGKLAFDRYLGKLRTIAGR